MDTSQNRLATALMVTLVAPVLTGCIAPGLFADDVALASIQFTVTMEGRSAAPASAEFSDTFRFAWIEREGLYRAVFDGGVYLAGLSYLEHNAIQPMPHPIRYAVDPETYQSHLSGATYPLLAPPAAGLKTWSFEYFHATWTVTSETVGDETTIHASSEWGAYSYTYTGKNPIHWRTFRLQPADTDEFILLKAQPLVELPTGITWSEFYGGETFGWGTAGSFSAQSSSSQPTTYVASINIACEEGIVPSQNEDTLSIYLQGDVVATESCPGEPRLRHWTVFDESLDFRGETEGSSFLDGGMLLRHQNGGFETRQYDFQIGVK